MSASAVIAGHPPDSAASTREVKRELGLFVGIAALLAMATNAGAAALDADLQHLADSSPAAQALLFSGAFLPLVAAVLARRLAGLPLRGAGWGWRRPPASVLLVAWLVPVVYAGVAAAAVWCAGAGGFDADGSAASTAVAVLAALTAGAVPFAALALGEELAWRGTFATGIARLTTPWRAAAVTGVLWSMLHWPLMLLVQGAVVGAPTPWGVACFTVSIVAISFPLHRLRMRSGSVWPPVVFHAAHNAAIYFVTDPLTTDRSATGWYAGETGLALAVSTVIVAAVLWRGWRVE